MFYYTLHFLIFLMLSVVCFSFDNPGQYDGQRRLNDYTICINGMTEAFGNNLLETKDAILCARHAIINLKLYGKHRSIYPLEVAYYYHDFQFKVNYENILLPKQFCTNKYGTTNEDCHRQLKIFEKDKIGQQNILLEYDSRAVQKIKDKLATPSGSKRARYSDSTQDSAGPSVEPPAIQYSDDSVVFSPEDLKLIQNLFPDYTQDSAGPSVEPPAVQCPSEKPPLKSKQMIILENALYYHKAGEVPEGVDMTDKSRKYFHTNKSYGELYLQKIARDIRTPYMVPKNMYGPQKFCRTLYPRQKRMDIIDD